MSNTSRPFGVILLNTLLECSARILGSQNDFLGKGVGTGTSSGIHAYTLKECMCVVERCAAVLCVLFVHGGQLSREIATVITTAHTSLHGTHVCTWCFIFDGLYYLSTRYVSYCSYSPY